MEHPNQDPAEDPFEVVLSDLSADRAGEPDERAPSTRRVGLARLSPRARARRILLVASGFLVLLVVLLGSQPMVLKQVVSFLFPADRFYLAIDVPWTQVALDGHPLALPSIGVGAPLHLARGHHLLTWTAAPFQPQQCSLDIPATTAPSCPVITQIRQGASGAFVSVIGLHESLDTLSVTQQQALIQAAQSALSDFSDLVQPGEPYLVDFGAGMFAQRIAQQPMRATLQLPLDTEAPADTCFLNRRSSETLRCTIAGQDCARFCSVPWQARQAGAAAADRLDWMTFAALSPASWSYATQAGVTTLQNQAICSCGAATQESLVLLDITWSGLAWHVQPLFGPSQGSPISWDNTPVADDLACLVAEEAFPEEIPTYARIRFVSGPNPAVGCLIQAALTTPEGMPAADAPVEEYLTRFGKLVTINPLAHQRDPQWPQADAYEQQLAQQLATLPGGLIAIVPRESAG